VTGTAARSGLAPGSGLSLSVRSFGAVLRRDVVVAGREIVPFLAQTILQPLFTLFFFGWLLTRLGFVKGNYASVLLPGIVALNGFLGGLQNTALPLVLDFSWSREIEDRLLAPMPITWVAAEKMIFGALRGILAALIMIPVGVLVLPGIAWPAGALAGAFAFVVLGSAAGAAIGMTLGTLVDARRINVIFGVVLVPLMFTGATQFPWRSLSNVRWFQVVCALNPLTYASEGMRSVLVPHVASIPAPADVAVLALTTAVFGAAGGRGFLRRAVD
jgi:ABC-2 type transport system permease protein